jgi:ATP-dependent Clp protease ATP-binding subunit ClpA
MFERFTDNARGVVVAAQKEARDLKHDYIGTEHVLLGLLRSWDGIGAQALTQLGITADMVRADIRSTVGEGKADPAKGSGHIPFTPRSKKLLELSLREALQHGHNYIGTEHILLAIERQREGLAAKILSDHLQDLTEIRRVVDGLMATHGSGGTPPPNRTSAAGEVVATAEALAGGAPMGSHHLLEALIRSEGSMAAAVLSQLGVSAAAIADKVDELDADQTTDATPQETAARKMEIRVDGDEVHLLFRDEGTLDLAKTIAELTGEGQILPTGPLTGRFVPLWTQMNELLRELVRSLQPEEEEEAKGVGKAALLVRRVMHDRLRRRQPPGEAAES